MGLSPVTLLDDSELGTGTYEKGPGLRLPLYVCQLPHSHSAILLLQASTHMLEPLHPIYTLLLETMAVLVDMLRLISDAFGDVEKLPAALVVCGGVLAAAAFRLAFFHSSEGVFFLRHGEVPFYLYRGTLIALVIFGFMEVFAGLWLRDDLTSRRQATGKTILGFSILPLILVAALGGFT